MKKLSLLLILVLCSFRLLAQNGFLYLNNDVINRYEPSLNKIGSTFHTDIKPYEISELKRSINADSLENSLSPKGEGKSCWVKRKLLYENLFTVNSDSLQLSIDPLANFTLGKDMKDRSRSPYQNSRGLLIKGNIGTKFGFSTGFFENQAVFLNYIDNAVRASRVAPGEGLTRPFKNGFDYNMAFGSIYYSPSKYFTFQFGHDKNFIGDGYRSLLLSDNAYDYPFFKISVNIWKIKYTSIFAEFQDLRAAHHYEEGFKKKYATFHYLSWNVTRRLSLGLFEAIIWQRGDSSYFKGIDINYLNPVIFLRPVEGNMDSPNNEVIGFNGKYKISNTVNVYGQIMLDEFNFQQIRQFNGWYANKQGYQLGLKAFDIFKIRNLSFQTEYNYVRPYSYSHITYTAGGTPIQNYAHYNQALAHPLGANFKEYVTFLRYSYRRFFIEAKLMYAIYGADSGSVNYGGDIFKNYILHPNEYGNYVGQGIRTVLTYKDLRISYLLNPKTNLCMELGLSMRSLSSDFASTQNNYVYFGIKTAILNHYYDY